VFTHTVICPHYYCGADISRDWSEYIVSSSAAGEGNKIEHTIQCDRLLCPRCKKFVRVYGSVWEDSQGEYEHHELNIAAL